MKCICNIVLSSLVLSVCTLLADPVKVIFDTDMCTDYDDVGALACLHALADAGECEILAVGSNTRGDGNRSVAVCEIVNAYYGRPGLPVGGCRAGGQNCAGARGYGLVDKYAKWVRHLDPDTAPLATDVYRAALEKASDASVVLCTVGFMNNVADLLRTDKALVERKVKLWVAMACKYPRGRECNSQNDAMASDYAFSNWPKRIPVIWTDFNYGVKCYAGRAVAELPDPFNPVRDAFANKLMPRAKVVPGKSWDQLAGHPSWDETAVLIAVRGWEPFFNLDRGTYRMVGTDGTNEWVPDAASASGRVIEKLTKDEVGKILDELMCRKPRCRAVEWRPSRRWCGFNMLGMFKKKIPAEALPLDPTFSRSPGFFAEEEFAWLRDWGFNFVRFPLDYRIWIKDGDWNVIDEEALKPLDEGIARAIKYGLHVQICLHRAPGFCINKPDEPGDLFRDPKVREVFIRHWTHLAKRYRHIPNEDLSFDLLNEPECHSEAEIATAFKATIAAIRKVDSERFIVLNGHACGRRPYETLGTLHNVGYSMRGYAPVHISHHQAEWWTPPPSQKPVWPPEGVASGRDWMLKEVFSYWLPSVDRGDFVMSNEFGCYCKTPHAVALAWMEDELKLWQEKKMGWALWNLRGRFGVLDSDRVDVDYEDFHGHKLDRKLLELLRKYARDL